MNEERERPTDIGDSIPVDPQQDFKDVFLPAGIYDASISSVRFLKIPDSDQYNPGAIQARVSYRIEDLENLDNNGITISGFGKSLSMVTNSGKNFGWKNWLKVMGYSVDKGGAGYDVKASDLVGRAVKLKLGTKQLTTDEGPRMVNTVEELWSRDS